MESDASLLILTTKEIENYLKVQHLAEPEISAIYRCGIKSFNKFDML
jgi:hypothetical protein